MKSHNSIICKQSGPCELSYSLDRTNRTYPKCHLSYFKLIRLLGMSYDDDVFFFSKLQLANPQHKLLSNVRPNKFINVIHSEHINRLNNSINTEVTFSFLIICLFQKVFIKKLSSTHMPVIKDMGHNRWPTFWKRNDNTFCKNWTYDHFSDFFSFEIIIMGYLQLVPLKNWFH